MLKPVKVSVDEWRGTVRLGTNAGRIQMLGGLAGPINVSCYGYERVTAMQLRTQCCAAPLSYSTGANMFYCLQCEEVQPWRKPFEQSVSVGQDRDRRLAIFHSWARTSMNVLQADLMALRLDALLTYCGDLS